MFTNLANELGPHLVGTSNLHRFFIVRAEEIELVLGWDFVCFHQNTIGNILGCPHQTLKKIGVMGFISDL